MRRSAQAEMTIADLCDTLVINTDRRPCYWVAGFDAVGIGIFSGSLLYKYIGLFASIAAGLLAACVIVAMDFRRRRNELRLTGTEFVRRGWIVGHLRRRIRLSAADIDWLEFQEEVKGPDGPDHPSGLYAASGRRSICLLPDLDESQTMQVIDRIEQKFPHLQQQWRGKSVFGQNIITLGLDNTR